MCKLRIESHLTQRARPSQAGALDPAPRLHRIPIRLRRLFPLHSNVEPRAPLHILGEQIPNIHKASLPKALLLVFLPTRNLTSVAKDSGHDISTAQFPFKKRLSIILYLDILPVESGEPPKQLVNLHDVVFSTEVRSGT